MLTPQPPALAVRLSTLRPGATARFDRAEVDSQSRDLLRALGLTQASRVTLCKVGEPFIVQVRATRIGLARSLAVGIFVIPESNGA